MMSTNKDKKRMLLNTLAPEIIYNIMYFMTYPEIYRFRSVCRKLKVMCEYYIFQEIKSSGQTIIIKLDGGKGKETSLELLPSQYDEKNCVIEFRPLQNHSSLSLANTSSQQCSAYHRLLKIHFSGWFNKRPSKKESMVFKKLSPQDQAMILYHLYYNSSIERTYELPSWNTNSTTDYRYLGDENLILSLSYQNTSPFINNNTLLVPQLSTESTPLLPTSYYSYRPSASIIPIAPRMEIQWVRVTLDWVLAGLQSNIPSSRIYKERFEQLDQLLVKEGCFKYDPLSEPILNYIVTHEQNENNLPESLINYVHAHTHECHTRLSRLQHMLEGAGVDARVLWKYTFAKLFVVGNGSLLVEEDVVRRIQDSEEEWRQKKMSLSRKFNSNIITTTT
ncbi:uncharacterized protein BX663DRAFT_516918 [Cokeromyces recurvatus]|uniref:uncharacterized protein n=1 Tax=Cokeromyces recurvatus TaxID=90255 RepID=UPI00221E3FA7|nr:uncharacterized protein BX663DRAFT_516918 [Cokeromyces recurvatus]KAI7900581.1 hypothetical protein BX663DRAFT_516918 [Cokeromyces recurvatus]